MNPACRISFDERPGYLRAHVRGERDTVEISTAYWAEIAARCRASAVRRLLVIEDIRQRTTLGDTVEIIDALVALGFRDMCIAYVDVHEDPSLLAQTEFLATRAGLVGRVFGDVDTAESWLLADAADRTEAAE
jgi:hypothetical protein